MLYDIICSRIFYDVLHDTWLWLCDCDMWYHANSNLKSLNKKIKEK